MYVHTSVILSQLRNDSLSFDYFCFKCQFLKYKEMLTFAIIMTMAFVMDNSFFILRHNLESMQVLEKYWLVN